MISVRTTLARARIRCKGRHKLKVCLPALKAEQPASVHVQPVWPAAATTGLGACFVEKGVRAFTVMITPSQIWPVESPKLTDEAHS